MRYLSKQNREAVQKTLPRKDFGYPTEILLPDGQRRLEDLQRAGVVLARLEHDLELELDGPVALAVDLAQVELRQRRRVEARLEELVGAHLGHARLIDRERHRPDGRPL